jgi:hypothetical protein
MTRLLVPTLLVVLALALVSTDAQAPGADFNHGIRLLGYEFRVGLSVQPVAPAPPDPVVVPDSLPEVEAEVEAEAAAEEVTR